MSTTGGGKKSPPRPPVGGPASRISAPEGGADNGVRRGPIGPPRAAGERRPDEAGMLEMVPLSADKDKAAAAEDPSATAFFAIPAPKADRAKAAPTMPPSGPPPGMPSGVGPPVARPPIGMGGASMGGGGMAAPPQPLVQGPVVSYGGAAQSPFQVSGPQGAAPPADSGQRVQSNRVYAILVAVFAMVGVAVVLAFWFRPVDKPEVPPPPPQPIATVAPTTPQPQEDTAPPAPVPVPPKPKAKSTTPSAPRPAPVSNGPANLTVHLQDASQATSVEVTCPSNFRQRASLKAGVGTVPLVPQESCNLIFHGGPPAAYGPVHGGQSLNCNIVGTTAVCK